MFAFAGNSFLCRMALKGDLIDPHNFTIVRILSGAITLGILVLFLHRHKTSKPTHAIRSTTCGPAGSAVGTASLFLYAWLFSMAYIALDTGVGALLLFGTVQLTLVIISINTGEVAKASDWFAIGLAAAGLVIFLLPGTTMPAIENSILMVLSGLAWAIYTYKGKSESQPMRATASNFKGASVLAIILLVIAPHWSSIRPEGLWLAIISGAVTSGVGYAIWYHVLPRLSILQSAMAQMTVPLIAAMAGILFLSEPLTLRFMVSTILVFGGMLTMLTMHYFKIRANH